MNPVVSGRRAPRAPFAGHTEDTIVLCAGSDEEVDTAFAVDGLTPGDDDIIYTLSGNSRP